MTDSRRDTNPGRNYTPAHRIKRKSAGHVTWLWPAQPNLRQDPFLSETRWACNYEFIQVGSELSKSPWFATTKGSIFLAVILSSFPSPSPYTPRQTWSRESEAVIAKMPRFDGWSGEFHLIDIDEVYFISLYVHTPFEYFLFRRQGVGRKVHCQDDNAS